MGIGKGIVENGRLHSVNKQNEKHLDSVIESLNLKTIATRT
jgi:hypothetical protein